MAFDVLQTIRLHFKIRKYNYSTGCSVIQFFPQREYIIMGFVTLSLCHRYPDGINVRPFSPLLVTEEQLGPDYESDGE